TDAEERRSIPSVAVRLPVTAPLIVIVFADRSAFTVASAPIVSVCSPTSIVPSIWPSIVRFSWLTIRPSMRSARPIQAATRRSSIGAFGSVGIRLLLVSQHSIGRTRQNVSRTVNGANPAARRRGYHGGPVRMAPLRWTARRDDAGIRLDKYLAAPERLASRAKASDALARGKVFLNDREASHGDAGARLAEGDEIRIWMDRPGSGRSRVALGDARDLPIVFEDEAIVVLNKPPGVLAVPLERRGDARSVFDDLK